MKMPRLFARQNPLPDNVRKYDMDDIAIPGARKGNEKNHFPGTKNEGEGHANPPQVCFEGSLKHYRIMMQKQRLDIDFLQKQSEEHVTEIHRLMKELEIQKEMVWYANAFPTLKDCQQELLKKDKEIQKLEQLCFEKAFGPIRSDCLSQAEGLAQKAAFHSQEVKRLRIELASVQLENTRLRSQQEELRTYTKKVLSRVLFDDCIEQWKSSDDPACSVSSRRFDEAAECMNQSPRKTFYTKYVIPLQLRKRKLGIKHEGICCWGEDWDENWKECCNVSDCSAPFENPSEPTCV